MKRVAPMYAAASIDAGHVQIGHSGHQRGIVSAEAKTFVDVDVPHPKGRPCLKLFLVLEGVEATKCTEVTMYLYGKDLEAVVNAIQTSGHNTDEEPSGDS